MLGINWTQAKWPGIMLDSPIKLYQCNISQSSFFSLQLENIAIQSCIAHELDFREANLSMSNMTDTDFLNSQFCHTDLTGADFTDAVNYSIDIALNKIKNAKFSFPEVVSLLNSLDIKVMGVD